MISRVLLILILGGLSQAGFTQVVSVLDMNGAPVQQAVVIIEGGKPVLTDPKGVAAIKAVESDQARVLIKHVAFEDWSGSISDLHRGAIQLKTKNVSIPEVNITSDHQAKAVSESIHSVKVISREVIEQSGASHLDQLLEMQQGVSVNRDMIMGAGIRLNGMGGQHVKILVDGVPLIGRLDGKIDASQLPLASVERIEIVNGPMSSSYGSDAAGGVINIITNKSVDGPFRAHASTMYESIGTYDIQGGAGLSSGRSSVMLDGGRYFFDGWSPTEAGRDQLWHPKEKYNGRVGYRYAGSRFIFYGQSQYFDEKLTDRGAPRITPYEAYAFDRLYYTRRFNQQISSEIWFSNQSKLQSSLAHSYWRRIRNTYRKDLVSLDQMPINGLEEQDTNRVQAWHGRTAYQLPFLEGKVSFLGGLEFQHETALGKRIENEKAVVSEYAVFSSLEFRPHPKIELKPSIRYGYHTSFDMPLIPSIALKYDWSPSATARFSYGRGFRAPSVKERYLYFVDVNHNVRGNLSLVPERSHNFHTNISWLLVNKPHWTLRSELNGFINSIEDEIALAQPDITSNLYTYVNTGKSKMHGIGSDLFLGIGLFSFEAGYTLHGKNEEKIESNYDYDYYPEVRFRAGYQFEKAGVSFNTWYKYNGASTGYILNGDNSISTFKSQAFALLDAAVGKSFGKNKWLVQIGIRNMLDVTDVNSNMPGSAHNDGSGTIAVGTGRTGFVKFTMNLSANNKSKTKNG